MVAESGRDAISHYLEALLTEEAISPPSSVASSPVAPLPAASPLAESPPTAKVVNPVTAASRAKPKPQKVVLPRATPIALEDAEKSKLQALLDRQFKPQLLPPAAVSLEPEAFTPTPVNVPDTIVAEPVSTAIETVLEGPQVWLPNGRPSWAQTRFDVLLLKVSGLALAVPLVVLGQIYPTKLGLKRVPGQAEWFMGMLPTRNGQIRTLNTAQFVMPERYDPTFINTAKYVVTIDQFPWGLAVDEVNQPVSLQPEDVIWRSERSKRAWLAGTVKTHMCALLDIPQMANLLVASEAANFRS